MVLTWQVLMMAVRASPIPPSVPHPVALGADSRQNTDLLLRCTPLGCSQRDVQRFVREELAARGERREWLIAQYLTIHPFALHYGWSPNGKRGYVKQGVGSSSMFVNFGEFRTGWFGRIRFTVQGHYAFNDRKRLVRVVGNASR